MKNILTLIFSLSLATLLSQTRPDQQPSVTDPNGNDAFYSQERGTLLKYRLDTLRGYYLPDIDTSAQTYTPGVDAVPTIDRYSIIKGADGNYYYIDKEKDYVRFGGNLGVGVSLYTDLDFTGTTGLSDGVDDEGEDFEVDNNTVLTGVDFNTLTAPGIYNNLYQGNGSNSPPASGVIAYYVWNIVLDANTLVQYAQQRRNFGGVDALYSRTRFNGSWKSWGRVSFDQSVQTTASVTSNVNDYDRPGVNSAPFDQLSLNVPDASNDWIIEATPGPAGSRTHQFAYSFGGVPRYFRRSMPLTNTADYSAWAEDWGADNDGTGSGLDADLLDGFQGSYYYSPANPQPVTGDDLGDHVADQNLILGFNQIRNNASTGAEFRLSSSSVNIQPSGSNSFQYIFNDEYLSFPNALTAPAAGVSGSHITYVLTTSEYGLTKTRKYLRKQEDFPTGQSGLVPTHNDRFVMESDYYRKNKVMDSTDDNFTTTADPAAEITDLKFSGIPAGRYRYSATIYHSKDSGTSTARSDFEFAITGSFDATNLHWTVEGDGSALIATKHHTDDFTGTAYPGTDIYKTTLILDVEFTSAGGSIAPEIEGEITSGLNDFINVHENSRAYLERLD